jgi:hypothetical protein
MKHLLTAGLAAAFLVGCVTAPPAPEPMAEGEEFHPTDALLIGGNGGFNPSGEEADAVDLFPEDEGPDLTGSTEKAFHPTDALLIGGNGGFNPTPDATDVVDLGLDDEPVKAFHPTDALLIGGNGPFNAKPDEEDEVDLGLDGWSWW